MCICVIHIACTSVLFTFCVHVYRGVYVYTHFVFVCVETREREREATMPKVSPECVLAGKLIFYCSLLENGLHLTYLGRLGTYLKAQHRWNANVNLKKLDLFSLSNKHPFAIETIHPNVELLVKNLSWNFLMFFIRAIQSGQSFLANLIYNSKVNKSTIL